MATVTREQVQTARDAGYRAGYALDPPTPNPYAPARVPVWDPRRRTAAARARLEREQRPALILARVWRVAYQEGQRARRRPRADSGR